MRSTFLASALLVVSLAGCAAYKQPVVFAPTEAPRVRTFFVRGLAFAISEGDSSLAVTEVQRAVVAGRTYVRAWILFKNRTSSEMLLEPQSRFRVEVRDRKFGDVITLKPELPSKILHNIEQEELINQVALSIGGALQAAAAQPTTVTGPAGQQYTVNDQGEKARQRASETAAVMGLVDEAYENYSSAINSGLLRRNTLVPDGAVHGYVYFPLRGFGEPTDEKQYGWGSTTTPGRKYAQEDLEFVVYLDSGDNAASVLFAPIAGE